MGGASTRKLAVKTCQNLSMDVLEFSRNRKTSRTCQSGAILHLFRARVLDYLTCRIKHLIQSRAPFRMSGLKLRLAADPRREFVSRASDRESRCHALEMLSICRR